MKSKINVFQQKENAVHRGNVYNTYTDTRDKYDLYFKNRFTTKNGGEKYDTFNTLSNDYVLYKLFEKGVGAQNSTWRTGKPNLANFNAYSQGYNDIAANHFPENDKQYIRKPGTVDGYTITLNLPTGLSHGTIVKNTIEDLGVGVDTDDIIQYQNGFYQKIYKEVFAGTGGIGKMVSVYPASYQSYNNLPNHWVKNAHDMDSAADEQAAYDVRDMYNQAHLPDSAYTSTELCLYIQIPNSYSSTHYWSNGNNVLITVKRNLNVNEFCVANAGRSGFNTAYGFYKVQSNYYYERIIQDGYYELGNYHDDIYETHTSGTGWHNLVELEPWVEDFLKQPNPYRFNYETAPQARKPALIYLTGQTDTSDLRLASANTNSNYLQNDPYPLSVVDSTAMIWTGYQNYWYQNMSMTITRTTKEYDGEGEYTNVYSDHDETKLWLENGVYVMKGVDCVVNPNGTSWISVVGADVSRINPMITQRTLFNADMDTDGCYEVEGTRYTWKPYNEVYQEINRAGGVFYQADMKIAKAYGTSNGEPIQNIHQDSGFSEYVSDTNFNGLVVKKSSIQGPSPITDINYDNYIGTRHNIDDYISIQAVKSYSIEMSFDVITQKPILSVDMIVYDKFNTNTTYNIKADLYITDTMSYLNEDFTITNGHYTYYFNTNIKEYINGVISANTTTYPYNISPYRAIVNNKLNLAWERDDYTGFNNGLAVYSDNISEPVEDFNEIINDYINTNIIDIQGFPSYSRIDMESLRYGFSYATEIYFPYRSLYDWEVASPYNKGFRAVVDYSQLQDLFDNGYENAIWQPNYVYDLTFPQDTHVFEDVRTATYEVVNPTHTQYNGHPMGIKPYRYGLKEENNTVSLQTTYVDSNKENYLYEIIFELAEPIPANTFYLLDTDRIKTNLIAAFDSPDPQEIYEVNDTYQVVKPSTKIKEWKYTTLTEYNNSNDERWLTQVVYEFPSGMLVPTEHWPQMLYENKRYKDVEIVSSDEMTYPNLGYYPPKEEMLPDNFKTSLEEGEAIYRYIGYINEYYSTVKAGSIYLPVGTDIEEELHLTEYDIPSENNFIETNPYGYEYIDEVDYINKNNLDHIATSSDFGAYPKDGVYSDDYGYEYIGTDEEVEYIGAEEDLRSNANYNIDINSSEDFSIGDVAGASFTVDIQGNIRDTIQYLGRKCKLYYDFENKEEYQDFGLFTIEDVKFMNHQVSTITAYDNIKKFDAPVYEYLTSENLAELYPMTAKTLFQLMCEYCEVPYYTNMEFLNSDKLIYAPFGDANLTARQALSYVAEVAAGYIVCDTNGFAVIKTIKPYLSVGTGEEIYTTYNENIVHMTGNSGSLIRRKYNSVRTQVNQRMDIFPTEVIDSIVFNNADTESFINYRSELNAIYDLSDNPILSYIDTQEDADEITNGILDQIAILVPVLYDTETAFYAGEIELKNFDLSTFGTKQVVYLLEEEKESEYFIPTAISISSTGVILTAKGQPKYSTKIVNSELAKQVNSLKMSVKEVKLQIPDALAQTLETHSEDISTIQEDLGGVQSDVSTLQSDLSTVEGTVSTLDTNLSTLEGNVSAQNTANSTRFGTIENKDQEQDGRLDAIELKDTGYDTTLAAHTQSITSLTTTVGGLPTKSYVDNLNQITSITNGGKLSIGEDEVSFYTDNGYLFISDGTTTGKLKLEVNV